MRNTITYKEYIGSVEFSEEDKCFFGKVQGIQTLISYEGSNADELINDFHSAVDDYIEMCKVSNIKPEIAYKGSFNIRIAPELHKKLAIIASSHNKSLNSCAEEALSLYANSIIM